MALIPLSRNPDYDLPDRALDVRGWTVRTAVDREKVGKVDDILMDDGGRLRYLDVDLGLFDKHVLLPLTRAHVDGAEDVVWVDGLAKDQFEQIPEYSFDARSLTPAYERRLDDDYALAAAGRTRSIADRDVPADREERARLARLGDMEEFRVASENSDPRGWKVLTGDGEKIGEVDELIVDTVSMQARYLDCDVAEDRLELEPLDRHILVPVERSRLDPGKKRVVVDGIFSSDIASYPVYGGLPLGSDAERAIDTVYDRPAAGDTVSGSAAAEDEVARHFYRLRRGNVAAREAGAPVRQRVDIDRVESETVGSDQEVRIRVKGDDIIIEKRAVD